MSSEKFSFGCLEGAILWKWPITFITAGQNWIARSATSLSESQLVEQNLISHVKCIFTDTLPHILVLYSWCCVCRLCYYICYIYVRVFVTAVFLSCYVFNKSWNENKNLFQLLKHPHLKKSGKNQPLDWNELLPSCWTLIKNLRHSFYDFTNFPFTGKHTSLKWMFF